MVSERKSNRGKLCRVSFTNWKQLTLCFRFKDSRSSILQEDPYILYDNGTLEIRIAQAQHNGKYTCVATNSLGIYENHVYLEVKGKSAPLWNLYLFD